MSLASGSTTPGETDWTPYGATGIYVDIDASAGRFTTTPVYITSIGGTPNGKHWRTTGATSIYNASSTKFRVYVRWADGTGLTPEQANSYEWHINWIGMEDEVIIS